MRIKRLLLLVTASLLFAFAESPAKESQTRQQIETPVHQAIQTRKATQQNQEHWRLEKEKMITRFDQLRKKQEGLQHQKKQLRRKIEATQDRLPAKEKQLADIEQVSNQIKSYFNKKKHKAAGTALQQLAARPAKKKFCPKRRTDWHQIWTI